MMMINKLKNQRNLAVLSTKVFEILKTKSFQSGKIHGGIFP